MVFMYFECKVFVMKIDVGLLVVLIILIEAVLFKLKFNKIVIIIVKKILNCAVVLNININGFCNNGLKLIIVLILINNNNGNNFVFILKLKRILNGFGLLLVFNMLELGKFIKIVFKFIGIKSVGLYFFFIFKYINSLLISIIIMCFGFWFIFIIF